MKDGFFSSFYNRISLLFVILLCVIGISTVWDYGMSWDEPYRYRGGQDKLNYYLAILDGEPQAEALAKDKLATYPGFFDLSLLFLALLSPVDLFYTGHIWTFVFGLSGIIACWQIGRLLGGPRCGFIALLLISLMPRYYGHMFMNPKDIPFAATYIWVIYFIIRLMPELPRISTESILKLGVALGLCMAVRIGGLVAFAYLGLGVLIYLLYQQQSKRDTLNLGWQLLGILVLAYIVLLPWWPMGHQNPVSATITTLLQSEQFPWTGAVLFEGDLTPASKLPFYYPLKWLLITTPEIVLLLILSGFFFIKKQLSKELTYKLQFLILTLAFVFPIFYVIAKKAVLYDGIRHLLFVMPPMACFAALIFTYWLDYFKNTSSKASYALWVILFVGVSLPSLKLFSLHPYQYTYFNAMSGGLNNAKGKYETEYWATGYKEAVESLAGRLDSNKLYHIALGQPHYNAYYFFPQNFYFVKDQKLADFSICTTRLNLDSHFDGDLFMTIEREGAPFVVIKDRRNLLAETKNAH